MASTERGAVAALIPASAMRLTSGGEQTSRLVLSNAEQRTIDTTKTFAGQDFAQALTDSRTGTHGYDARADRGAVFYYPPNLASFGAGAAPTTTTWYLMAGLGNGNVQRFWVVQRTPDFTAAFYTGADTPLSNIYASGRWVTSTT